MKVQNVYFVDHTHHQIESQTIFFYPKSSLCCVRLDHPQVALMYRHQSFIINISVLVGKL